MGFMNIIALVRDIGKSRRLYECLLGLQVFDEAEGFVLFKKGFAIYDGPGLERPV